MIKDWLEYQGHAPVHASREASREPFRLGLVADAEVRMTMITSRNYSSHTYHQGIEDAIGQQILTSFHPAFFALSATRQAKATP